MSELQNDNKLLPNRLNAEPVIFKGCSLSELMFLAGFGGVVCITLCLFICGLLGYLMMGVGLGVLLTIAWVIIGAMWLQKAKRGRPIYYYQTRIKLWLEDKHLIKTDFIRKSQVWSIGRTRGSR